MQPFQGCTSLDRQAREDRRHREKAAQALDNPYGWGACVVVCAFSTGRLDPVGQAGTGCSAAPDRLLGHWLPLRLIPLLAPLPGSSCRRP